MAGRQNNPKPDPAILQNMMQAAVQHHGRGNLSKAQALYRQVLQAAPRHPDALHLLGVCAYQQGALPQAIELIQKSLKHNAKNPDAHYNLAKAYRDAGDPALAERHYKLALRLRPDVDTHFNLANVYLGEGRFNEAAEHYRAALKLKPDYAEAHYSLIDILEKANRIDDMREAVQAMALALGDHPLVTLADGQLLRRDKDFAAARACLEGLADDPRLPPFALKRKHFMLGKVCDRLDDADSAFDNFQRANAIARDIAEGANVHAGRFIDRLNAHARCFTQDWVEGWAPFTPADGRDDPVFLVGFPRSGTTLLDTILLSHPEIAVVEEVDAVTQAYGELHLGDGLDDLADIARAGRLKAYRKAYFKAMDGHLDKKDRGKVLVDKMPLNAIYAGVIKRAFPNAKFILALRHPCDCVLSCFMQDFALNDAMANFLDITDAARLYDKVFTLWDQYTDVLDLDVHGLRYEDLVVDLEGQIKPLLDFLSLDWDDAMGDYTETARARGHINTPSYHQVTEKLYTRASGRWEKYRPNLEPVIGTLKPWAEKYGYAV